MLAGRKLLLADDSVTIQKVIELTFADEGMRVVAFSDGQEAVEHLEEEAPDVVLADVFMPSRTGYEVCEYVKQNGKLKHIPVMLLVGSFEPFDEAEARRVGADEILTKPFQSIRRLIDRVGALVSHAPSEADIPTSELEPISEIREDQSKLNTQELELSTADTLPLSDELQETLELPRPVVTNGNGSSEEKMETVTAGLNKEVDSSEVLLDLGEFEPRAVAVTGEFELDLDLPIIEETANAPVEVALERQAFIEPTVAESVPAEFPSTEFTDHFESSPSVAAEPEVQPYFAEETATSFVEETATEPVQVSPAEVVPQEVESAQVVESAPAETTVSQSGTVSGELSPQMIDAIARRVVEMMSQDVVQRIAWEVVPDLAELLIKRQLEDQASQPK